jgi:hypothetical protein
MPKEMTGVAAPTATQRMSPAAHYSPQIRSSRKPSFGYLGKTVGVLLGP